MNPQDVQPRNFRPVEVIYTSPDGFFSIGIGFGDGGNEYATSSLRFGMRWNGHTEEEKGFPASNGYPLWFQLPDDIGSIMKVLYDNSNRVGQAGDHRPDLTVRR
ncbi:MAG: hypothetical protein V4561_10145 [Bacteroidota bacterium]